MKTRSEPVRAFAALLTLLIISACNEQATTFGAEPAVDAVETAKPSVTPKTTVSLQPPKIADMTRIVERVLEVERGDLAEMITKERVRVLVPYAPPYYFIDRGQPRGITFEAFREYGDFVRKREGLKPDDFEVIYVPCELGDVIPWLTAGYGDIAAYGLTITPERISEVAFADPVLAGVEEIVVTSSRSKNIATLDDLAGRDVWIVPGSSYSKHLESFSAELVVRGLEAINVREAPDSLSTEELLEMVNAGILDLTVCDDYKADLWAQVLPELRPRPDLVINSGGALAWAVRKDNPKLRESLNAFAAESKKGTLLGNILFNRYFKTTKWILNPTDEAGQEQLQRYADWMKELAEEYRFDWLRIAAQCFQESGLDPNAQSSAGAIGLMQLLPSTAKDMGCDDLHDAEQNLRAGVRYLDWLRTHFFSDPELDEVNRTEFILAAYNAGPGNVSKWRKEAPKQGLDPNRWRGHVERIAIESVGIQPVRYVNNIQKFYVAYSLAYELRNERTLQIGSRR